MNTTWFRNSSAMQNYFDELLVLFGFDVAVN